ncbi:hypothetical protein CKAH01_10726 [Colletotrichum kahawae]|uniref:Uncharacterized protein n=1 Tax=Colletotrichum kahawae TaxID=34407 RepID=A0AAE0CYJ8_COLKA|nr:hypothetical protein CKAH01_10726 [Colletotrichum kahawae]
MAAANMADMPPTSSQSHFDKFTNFVPDNTASFDDEFARLASSQNWCDETRPNCLACVRRGVECSGYDRTISFKDVTALVAESSRKFETARWSALRLEDARRRRRRTEEARGAPSGGTQGPAPSTLAPLSPHLTTDGWSGGAFALPWPLFATSSGPGLEILQSGDPDVGDVGPLREATPLLGRAMHEDQSTNESSPEDFTLPAWDEFIVSQEPSTDSTSSSDSLLGEPTTDCQLSLPVEEALIHHFDKKIAPTIPVALAFTNLFQRSSCFRAAVLALSASNLQLAQRLPLDLESLRRVCDDKSVWIYYDTAVKDLQAQLQHVEQRSSEELAGAALLLAYHEIEAGTALGIRNHASGLDAIASKLDFAASSVPELFKAWRMLRYDVRFMMTPTRKTYNPVDNYDVSSLLDPQLAIRDILSRLHNMYARHAMEASFDPTANTDGPSASEQAAMWIRSSLGRECDHRNYQRGDFHKDSLTRETVLHSCDTFSRRLDSWHRALCDHDLPIARLGTDEDFVSGPSFEPVVTYRFADERKALDYMLYLVSRMIVTYLRSVFDPAVSASATNTWAKLILGIVCGMDVHQRQQFTVLRVDNILSVTAKLCESTNFATTVLDYLLPKIIGPGLTGPDMVGWAYLKSTLELGVREKRRGRALRFILDGTEEDSSIWEIVARHHVVAFGDYNGKGYFRDCYVIDCLP